MSYKLGFDIAIKRRLGFDVKNVWQIATNRVAACRLRGDNMDFYCELLAQITTLTSKNCNKTVMSGLGAIVHLYNCYCHLSISEFQKFQADLLSWLIQKLWLTSGPCSTSTGQFNMIWILYKKLCDFSDVHRPWSYSIKTDLSHSKSNYRFRLPLQIYLKKWLVLVTLMWSYPKNKNNQGGWLMRSYYIQNDIRFA